MFIIDGMDFNDTVAITSLTEKFDILSGKNSGRTQDGRMYIEQIGTYFNYSMTFSRKPNGSLTEWDNFKNLLANPKNDHLITVWKDQGMLEEHWVYISGGQRNLIRTKHLSGNNYESYWGDLTVDFISMEPFNNF